MTQPSEPEIAFIERPDRPRIATRHRRAAPDKADRPTLVFLPGYMSDMQGGKALAVDAWAARTGHAMLRFDYAGCGESDGDFDAQSFADWLRDALAAIDAVAPGPVLLVGSSMGGWLMLHAAMARRERTHAMIGIAVAPDFTMWGFSQDEKMKILSQGRLERPSDYGPEPMVTTRTFWQSGEGHRLLHGPIDIGCPTRLLHGQVDTDVPWQYGLETAKLLGSSDVQTILIKDGDHRLSRPADIGLLLRQVEDLLGQ